MGGPTSVAVVRNLMDGAMAAAKFNAPAEVPVAPMTAVRWAWRLLGLYQTTHATPTVIAEVGVRFAEAGRADLADHAARTVREERGHDRLALADLEALGYRARAFVDSLEHPTAAALVACFRAMARSHRPVRVLGYAYALERVAAAVTRADIEKIEAVLPAGIRATRCLRVHSMLGADTDHVTEGVETIAVLSADERTEVALACHHTAVLLCTPPPGGHPTDTALTTLFSPFRKEA